VEDSISKEFIATLNQLFMKHAAKSIRAFIGSLNFEESRQFYKDLGFEESSISKDMSYMKITTNLGFYLQNAFVKDWINNSMIFLEVDDVNRYWKELQSLNLPQKYKNVKLTSIREENWGRECFLHDPSGVLWHFGEFKPSVPE
jgi:hypothetical protein